MRIPTTNIIPNPDQPRKEFNDIDELAESIRQHGLLNPIAVEETYQQGIYMIIDGERRWRAAMKAGLIEMDVKVFGKDDDVKRLIRSMTGNLQRQDMNPLETAMAYKKLHDAGYTKDEIAGYVGKTYSTVQRYLTLLDMPKEIQEIYRSGKLKFETNGYMALLSIQDKGIQLKVARAAVKKDLSGPQIRAMAKRMGFVHRKRSHKAEPARKYDGHWNMMVQAGIVPSYEKLEKSAVKTCNNCALYEDASHAICRDCPAVVLIKLLN